MRAFLVALLVFAAAPGGSAQITSATMSGTVKDQTQAVLPGVDVVVRNVDTGLNRAVVTDANGYFTIAGLPPGTYEARASLAGFGTAVERVTLAVAQEAAVSLALKVSGTAESITVVGAVLVMMGITLRLGASKKTLRGEQKWSCGGPSTE